jgi:hypothetical protein
LQFMSAVSVNFLTRRFFVASRTTGLCLQDPVNRPSGLCLQDPVNRPSGLCLQDPVNRPSGLISKTNL